MRWPFYRRSKSCSIPSANVRKTHFMSSHVWSGCGVVRTNSWNSVECGLCCSRDLAGELGQEDPVVEDGESSCAELSQAGGSDCSLEENWTRNPEFSDRGSFGMGGGQSFAVRTADRWLAELGQKALDRGLLSPLEESTQVKVQITGDQGQVWSTNPVFSTGNDVSYLHSPVGLGGDTDSAQVPFLHSATDISSEMCWGIHDTADFITDGAVHNAQLARSNIGSSRSRGNESSVNDSMELDLFTIDTPRFERRAVSNLSDETGLSKHAPRNTEEAGVQSVHGNGSARLGTVDSPEGFQHTPSSSQLHELTELKQCIEIREQELMDSFALLSEKLTPYPNIMSKSLDEIRTLQTMVEEKDLQITRLYSQVYEEVWKAQQFIRHRWMQNPIPTVWERCLPEVRTSISPPGLEYPSHNSQGNTAFDTLSLSEQEDCSPRNPPSSDALTRMSESPPVLSSPTASAANSSFDMVSDSDYAQIEGHPISRVAYEQLLRRIQLLENDVKEKEVLISQKDSLLRQIYTDQGLKACPSDLAPVIGRARDLSTVNFSICENLRSFSPQVMKRRVPIEELERLCAQQNPP